MINGFDGVDEKVHGGGGWPFLRGGVFTTYFECT